MKFIHCQHQAHQQKTPCVVVSIFANKKLSDSAQLIDKASQGIIRRLLKRGDMNGEVGETLLLPEVDGIAAERVLLLGCGKPKELNAIAYGKILNAMLSQLKQTKLSAACVYLNDLTIKKKSLTWTIQQLILTAQLSTYQFTEIKHKNSKPSPALKNIGLYGSKIEVTKAIKTTTAFAKGMTYYMDLANTPANICNPSYLAKQAQNLGRKYKSLQTKILSEAQMAKLGMNTLLSVSKGSAQAAKLICFEYKGAAKSTQPIVFVGKGITFDTGGLSLKTPNNMIGMKYDMCGGATIFGLMQAIAELKLPLNVIGIIAAVENMPNGNATRPEDVVTSMSGQTVEILNTDAEGRLVLADALSYAKRYNPDVVIDIATLTGAIIVALGSQACGIMGNDQMLADELLVAGEESGDRAWQLPLWEEYQEELKSNTADLCNIGSSRTAGSIVAGSFLANFAKDFRWVHMDIAGVAFKGGDARHCTGRPIPLLMQFLLKRLEK